MDGIPQVAGEFEAAGRTHSGRALKGSGYPVRFPFVDLAEISAGGGTIAWIDAADALRVGPLSAGADPGPACYGKSDRPTVTDANVVLGRLNPQYLLGGDFAIDASRAQSALETLAQKLGTSLEGAAAGVVRLVDDAMANVLRIVTVERGLDPRDFTLVAFGGGGPLHACAVSQELGIRRIAVPLHPGLFSAFGLLAAKLHYNELRPVLRSLREIDDAAVASAFGAMERRARKALSEQGADPDGIQFKREYDARYRGQSFELAVEYDRDCGNGRAGLRAGAPRPLRIRRSRRGDRDRQRPVNGVRHRAGDGRRAADGRRGRGKHRTWRNALFGPARISNVSPF